MKRTKRKTKKQVVNPYVYTVDSLVQTDEFLPYADILRANVGNGKVSKEDARKIVSEHLEREVM